MAHNYNYVPSTLPAGASLGSPGGNREPPTWSMRPQIHPSGLVPSDEVLMKSLYKQLLKSRWTLQYMPAHDSPDEYGLPPSLTGNSIWLQRKTAFFREHREIRERDVYVVNKTTFLGWIEDRFNPRTVGACGATQDLCLIVGRYVFWVDRAAAPPPAFDVPSSMDSGHCFYGYDYSGTAGGGSQYYEESGSSSHLTRRIQGWQDDIPRSQGSGPQSGAWGSEWDE
ncbi:hypothetical protein F5B17DRAFT_426863 [Nemania serpens]|nr:hypothetical protein F5B17DRAFT_426863 [Nemania serpens]